MPTTPGPWDTTTRQGSWDWVVFQVENPNIEICQPFHDGSEENETGEANARLIAAAPDLLAAVKEAKYFFDDDFPDGPDGPCAVTERYRAAYKLILGAIAKSGIDTKL